MSEDYFDKLVSLDHKPLSKWKEKLSKPPVTIPWVVDKFLVQGGATLLVSEGGVGKSWFAAHIASQVACGGQVHEEFEVLSPGNVLWYDNENGVEENDRRVQLLLPSGYAQSDFDVHMREVPDFSFKADLAGIETLRKDIRAIKPKLVVIDSFISIFYDEKNESSSNDVRAIFDDITNALKGIEDPPALLFLHHAKKGDDSKAETWPEYRGSSDFRNAVNFLISMRKRKDGDQKFVQFKWDKSRRGMSPDGVFEFSLVDETYQDPDTPFLSKEMVKYTVSEQAPDFYDELVDTIKAIFEKNEDDEIPDGHLISLIQERYPSPPSTPFLRNVLYRAAKDSETTITREKKGKGEKLKFIYTLNQ